MPKNSSSHSQGPIWPIRRRYDRKIVIESQLVKVDLGRQGQALVIDIGEGGMQVQPYVPLQLGNASELCFEIPGKNARFQGTAMVAWVGAGGRAGIQFLNVPESSRALLREWLAVPVLEASLEEAQPEPVPLPSALKEATQEIDPDTALRLIAERTVSITGAHGAAIAIGDNCGMFCRASVGNAPDVGVPVRADSGLSGFCLRSSQLVQCDDTQADVRVDPVACQQLNLRSVLIVPVQFGGRLVGLLEVFSSKPYAFDTRDRERLTRMAQLIAAVIGGGDLGPLTSASAMSTDVSRQAVPGQEESKSTTAQDSAVEPLAKSVKADAKKGEHATTPSPVIKVFLAVPLVVAIASALGRFAA
ncbi:MAG: GAF domain-containing protein [Terriglobales bacterium]